MQDFVEYVIKNLVDQPEAVTVTEVENNGSTVYELRLDPDDVAKVIGRRGVTINAIRSLVQAGGAKKGMRCGLEIIEDEDEGEDED
jgi:predicted RNA-binding protein YlqC (UPF0109 family)